MGNKDLRKAGNSQVMWPAFTEHEKEKKNKNIKRTECLVSHMPFLSSVPQNRLPPGLSVSCPYSHPCHINLGPPELRGRW